jgi:RNA polymerase sigma-70 factor (ECF subfamily)
MTLAGSNARVTAALPSPRASPQFEQDLIALIPGMRSFSRMLCPNRAAAEDLTQEGLTKAWRARDRFQQGTNLKAWVFTILRNEFYSEHRRAWRNVHWDETLAETIPVAPKEQEWAMDISDVARALAQLPKCQREAVILVAAGGFSYAEAADICGAKVGSMKSRVSRGRATLARILDGEEPLSPRSSVPGKMGLEDIQAQLVSLSAARTGHAAAFIAAA